MKKIWFIVNPFSGIYRKQRLPQRLRRMIDTTKFDYTIQLTEGPAHATEIAREAVAKGIDIVVAVGGDGSVNEVAAGLVDTDVALGILPLGSGNGYAMHLGLGRGLPKAIKALHHGKVIKVDTAKMNERCFVNLSGIGFDGAIAHALKSNKLRGFWAYFSNAVKQSLSYKAQLYEIQINGKRLERECFIIEVANAPMFGYGFELASSAILDDGYLDVSIINKRPKWRYIVALPRVLFRSFQKAPFVENYRCRELKVHLPQSTPMHIDGEGFFQQGDLHFSIHPSSLNVIVPQDFK